LRIWIDTDLGSDVDDALALAYALRHPELELVGVSTVFGDVSLRTRITRALLEVAGQASVPVVTGLGAPLTPDRPGRMFGHEGLGLLPEPRPVLESRSNPGAGERIAAIADALDATRPDLLVAIGPLTNLAALVLADHALPPLVVMGGRFTAEPLPGMLPEIPEWNWWCDPVAVQTVLAAPLAAPPRVVPLDVTWSTRLEAGDLERLAGGDALARTLARLGDEWLVAQRDRLGAREPCIRLHDPLALVCLTHPDLVAFSDTRIRVGDAGDTRPDPTAALVRVAGPVDNAALRTCLLDMWLGRARRQGTGSPSSIQPPAARRNAKAGSAKTAVRAK